jgi:hypothetical protein
MSSQNADDFAFGVGESFTVRAETDGKIKGSNLEKVRRVTKERSMR